MLLSLPRPQIIQNRGDGHAFFDEDAGAAPALTSQYSESR